jgi:hypothetical protein
VSLVYGGPIIWDFAHARDVIRFYRDFLPSAPEELGVFLGLKKVPAADPFPREIWGTVICALVSCYNGDAERGAQVMRPIRDSLPQPLIDGTAPMPFPALQAMFDPLLPKGLQWYWKCDFVQELPDEAIEAHLAHAKQMPGELSLMHLYPIDGAVHRIAPDETAWRFRDVTWSMVIAGIDSNPGRAGELKEWGRAYWEAVHPFAAGGGYVNFMMGDEGQDQIRATYGANYERLAAIKAKYDPGNLFRVNHNIVASPESQTRH